MAHTTPRILLVDDEQALTRLMQTYLSKLGYIVDSSLDAADALGKFTARLADDEPYDLVVADLTLPDMPGQDMALQMLERQPGLRVLLCSGYPLAVESLPPETQIHFASLQKPFLPNMLAKAVDDLLKSR